MSSRWGALGAMLIVLALVSPACAGATSAVRLTARFDEGAVLGGTSAINAELHIDSARLPSQLTRVRVLYPNGLGLFTSGLGIATCTLAPNVFRAVLVSGPLHGGCPANAVLGYGTVHAEVRLLSGQVVPESATITVLAGPLKPDGLGLVAFVDGQHPFGARLALAGTVSPSRGRFGGTLSVRVPPIPSIADLATVAVTDMHLAIGSRRIVYYRHAGQQRIPYHPAGIGLPTNCPGHGFRFRTQLDFLDGSHARADAIVSCRMF